MIRHAKDPKVPPAPPSPTAGFDDVGRIVRVPLASEPDEGSGEFMDDIMSFLATAESKEEASAADTQSAFLSGTGTDLTEEERSEAIVQDIIDEHSSHSGAAVRRSSESRQAGQHKQRGNNSGHSSVRTSGNPAGRSSSRSGSGSADVSSSDTVKAAEEDRRERSSRASLRARRQLARKKRRRKADLRISLIMSMVFFVFMLVIALCLIVIPRSTTSEIEKRNLSQWPSFSFSSYFSGEYTEGIKQYYDDTVPDRDNLKNLGNSVKSLFGFTTSDSVEIVGNLKKIEDQTVEETSAAEELQTTEAETAAAISNNQEVLEDPRNSKDYRAENADAAFEDNILIVYQDGHWRGMSMYAGYHDPTYTDSINYIRDMIDPSINVYVMPIPTAVQYYLPANYEGYSADMLPVYEDNVAALTDGVVPINIIDVLEDHNQEPIFLRTDHHWSQLGAYYAAKEFARAADLDFPDLEEYTEYITEGYLGTLYSYTGSTNLLNDPEDFLFYVPTNNYAVDYYDRTFHHSFQGTMFADTSVYDSYSSFIGGDDHIVKITTKVGNGKTLLMIKDSYGNAMVPFFANSYDTIYIVDQRYFEINLLNFIYYIEPTDILITHNYYAMLDAEAELLEYITYAYADVPIEDDAPEPLFLRDDEEDTDRQTEDAAADTAEDAADGSAEENYASDEENNPDPDVSDEYYDDTENYDEYYEG